MNSNAEAFIKLVKHPVRFRMFLFFKLPSAWFAGVRVREIDENCCRVTIPYKWFSRNPFRSTYFACLSMAAEMSTGALAMMHLYKLKPTVSMLVLKAESEYFKKVTGKATFTCCDGLKLKEVIQQAVEMKEAKVFTAVSTGTNESGETIAKFLITWSFKARAN